MKYFVLFCIALAFSTRAQFDIIPLEHHEDHYIDVPGSIAATSLFFRLSSDERPEIAQEINNSLYKELFVFSDYEQHPFDSIFPVSDKYGLKQAYNYEIIENSDRFFTVHVTYKRPNKETSHRFYTFVGNTGELKNMFDLIDEDGYYTLAERAFSIYAIELDDYIAKFSSSEEGVQEQIDELEICASNYFTEEYRFEYGFIYLTSDSVFCTNPFCPEIEVELDRREWFKCAFTYDEMEGIFSDLMITYGKTGIWEYTLDEKLWDAEMYPGKINERNAELKLVRIDEEKYQGKLLVMNPIEVYYIAVQFEGKKAWIKLLDDEGVGSELKYKDGRLSGEFEMEGNVRLNLEFNYSTTK